MRKRIPTYMRTPTIPNKPVFKVYSESVSPVEANMQSRNMRPLNIVSGFSCMPSGLSFKVTPGKILLYDGNDAKRYTVSGLSYTISQVAPLAKSVEYIAALKIPEPGHRPLIEVFKKHAIKPLHSSWAVLFEIKLPKGASRISDGEIIYRFKDRCYAMEYAYYPDQPDGVRTEFIVPFQTVRGNFRVLINGEEKPEVNVEEENFATYTKYTLLDGAPPAGAVLFIDFMAVTP